MVFSSLFFVFLFFALNMLIYSLVRGIKGKNIVLLVFSIIFYSWAGPKFLLLLLGMVIIAWVCANHIGLNVGTPKAKKFLVIDLVLQLGLLMVFKYLNFFTGITSGLFGFPDKATAIILPVGISFYTFQLISYVVDVYRGEIKPQKKFFNLLLYASLFHQCIAGPIVRYQLIENEITDRQVSLEDFCAGVKRFTYGLAKKAILANGCAAVADNLFTDDAGILSALPAGGLWLGLLFFMLEIYLDFSAYSDMAIGMGRMVGFHYAENFNLPYVANSIKDFWNRWHISLSTFFRDYVYIPLGGNRKGTARQIINLFIVWGLTGFWHGASWNYMLWGLYFFVFITIENLGWGKALKKLPGFVGHIYALIVIYFGWALFRLETLSNLGIALKGMFTGNGLGFMNGATMIILKNNIFLLVFCIIVCTPLIGWIGKKMKYMLVNKWNKPGLWYAYEVIMPAFMLFIALIALIGNSYNPFLYFQF